MADKTESIKPGSSKTGTRPSGNTMGMQGSGLAPTNPKGQSATAPTGIMSKGKGTGSKKP